ncbi:MAG TPA: prolyl oligopeptidase family serine peptidase, partial [Gaiellaceae bacterium]|nr:prolyl oligopeptidase family serine peptidase [Gaiellaceae bacterium]
ADQSWPVRTKTGKTAATQLTHLRGEQGQPRFSPDGRRLAFASDRQTHAFVGVLDLAAKRVTWMSPSVDRDLFPTWAPDGTKLLFLRLAAREAPPAFVARPSGQPWSLVVADAATGVGHELFRAAPGDGSVFHFFETQERNLWWSADERVLFPWEKTGWHHVWSIPAAGGEPVDLTPGTGEVEHATLAPDGRTLYFTTNVGDLDGRRLDRVAAAGGEASRIDAGDDKFEFFPAPLAGGALAWLETAAREPLTVVLASDGNNGSHGRPLRPEAIPVSFPAAGLQIPKNVVFPSTDGLAIHGQLFLPSAATAGAKSPALIFVHGGPVRQMFAAFHPMDYYHQAYAVNQLLAARGFVVLSVNYRSGIGYGLHFREAEGIGETSASEFQDVLGGALYLESLPTVDGERIGIWGGSYGGYLTAMALARASNLFKAGVDYHGVHDWNLEFSNPPFTRTYLETADRLARAWRASPMADVAKWRSPVLLIQGDDDHNVPFAETIRLTEALRKAHVPLDLLVFPDEIHGFLLHRSWMTAYAATVDFLERQLGLVN